MVLQALNRYYGILANDPESGIAPPGYSVANVSFALNLSPQGDLLDVFPLLETVQRGKKTMEVPRRMLVPEQVKRASGIAANFLCDNAAYVLGLSDKEASDPEYANKRFAAFVSRNRSLLEQADCVEARAVIAFLDGYDPQHGREHPVIRTHLEDLFKGGNLVFRVQGSPGFVHECAQVRQVWEAPQASPSGEDVLGQCLVTGERAPIARLHASLRGIKGANSTGATLVGFNAAAYESYNRIKGQGLNSPVSQQATFAYTTALNYLLSPESKNRKFTIGDATVVYWAESADETYADLFESLFGSNFEESMEGEGRKKAGERLKQIVERVSRGQAVDFDRVLEGLDPSTRFYVLGLAPNAARVSVRFFHMDAFRKTIQKITTHYLDLRIQKEFDNQPDFIPYWQLLGETVSAKASDKTPSPLMAGALLRAILDNTPYPAALYYQLINRIRADQDDTKKNIRKINYVRAAAIKAYLLRKSRRQDANPYQEVCSMSLNEESTNQAYLLGRLFAVLEKAQKEAISNANATITDRYFTSACASPVSVFPVLLRLSRHHIAKAEYGSRLDRKIGEIMNLLEVNERPFPARLSLDEQGIFILGYYHQRSDFYTPKNGSQAAVETQSTL